MKSVACSDMPDLESVLAAARDSPRCRDLLDLLPVAIYMTDAQGHLTHFNQAAVVMSGRTPELGTDKWCVTWKLYHPDGRPMPHDECPMAVALKEGRAVRGAQAIAERPDGTLFWFEPFPTPLFDAAGNVTGGLNLLLDITERKRAETRLADEAASLGKLTELSSRLWRAPTLRAGLDEMLAATIELLGADFGNVQVLDRSRGVLLIEAQRGFDQPFLDTFREVSAADDSVSGRALRTGERLVVEDVLSDAPFAPLREVARAAGFRGVQSTPLIGRDGVPLGMLSTHWRTPHRPDAQTLRRLDLYVRQAVDFIERKRNEESLRHNREELAEELQAIERLQRVSMHLLGSDNGESLYEHIMDVAVALMRSDFGSLQMVLPKRGPAGEVPWLASRGFDPEAVRLWQSVPVEPASPCGQALRSGERAIAGDVETCEDLAGTATLGVYRRAGVRAVQSTPLISRRGTLLGVLSTHWKQPHRPSQRDLRRLDVLARQAADWIERNLSQAALRDSEERFRAFTSATSDVVFRTSADWSELRRLRGREFIPDMLEPSRNWLEAYIHPDDQPLVRKTIQAAIEAKSTYELEHRVVRRDGSFGWTHSRAIPIVDDQGEIVEWIGAASDVTRRKAAEEALRARETAMAGQREALEQAIEEAPLETSLGVLVRAAIRAVGGQARAGFYLANAEKTALHYVVGMGPEYAAAVDGFTVGPDSLACGLATHTGKPVLTADVREDPLWQPWLWLAEKFDYRACWSFPIHSARESFIGTLAVYSHEPREATPRDVEICSLLTRTAAVVISRHKEAQARRRMEQALRDSEARHRQTLALMPAAVYTCDAAGVITYFNQRAAHLWGRAPVLGDTDERFCGSAQLELPDGTPLPHDQCPMAIALREGRSFRDAEVGIRRPDGSLVEVSVNIDPVRDADGLIVAAINAFHDITAVKRAEQALRLSVAELREAEEALKEADRRKDEFLATLAHELRNPLAPIRNSLHILRLAGGSAGATGHVQEVMDRQVSHMVRLVDDLMEVSRITRGKIELRKERIDLAAVVQGAVETSMPLIEAAGHRLSLDLPREPLTLEADPVRLTQVFSNLLNNAVKYTEDGGQIWLTVEREVSNAVISVRDSGLGIPAEMLPKVFELFAQVDRSYGRSRGGLGIGLTLVRSIVSMHGGRVEARSDGPGRGSEFVVRLPLAVEQVSRQEGEAPNGRTEALPARRILVVDDNRDAADSLAVLLQILGADVRMAYDGEAALEALRTFKPSATLLDIGMPGMDGFEVARRARREPEGRNVMLIALTGWGQEEHRRRSREAGFDHHLVKPVDLSALQVLLESLPQPQVLQEAD